MWELHEYCHNSLQQSFMWMPNELAATEYIVNMLGFITVNTNVLFQSCFELLNPFA